MKRSITTLLSILVLVIGLAPDVQADSASVIKSRMENRLTQVVSLKMSESIGENNQGYLAARSSLSATNTALVKAENSDRKSVYQLIAAKTKSTATIVGKTRASSIRESAAKGSWVQLANGTWKKV
ncbi:MAG: hypothetical protein ACI9FG_000663 [Crocinitomicaceae bacterium]|jgi:uncharacterized protein YdbL (DUF1318 family)